jgi:hypothetical protein
LAHRLPDLPALSVRPLFYEDPAAAAALGLPPHVSAASSVALVGDRLFVVQDDVHALAVVDPITATARPLPLDLPGGLVREKADKADFEACTLLPDGRLLVVGSGSRATRRVAFAVDTKSTEPSSTRLQSAAFYDAVDAGIARIGGLTNIEGLSITNDATTVLHRGPGAGSGSNGRCAVLRIPTEAVLRALYDGTPIDPAAVKALPIDLGAIDDDPITWTDGVDVYGIGVVFTGACERTAHVEEDGVCTASVLGLLPRQGPLSWARLLEPNGAPMQRKVEGLAIAGERAWLVVDADDPAAASVLVEVPFGALQ